MAELFGYIDAQHEVLRAAYESVPVEKRAVRPAPDVWSATDVLGHLTIVEGMMAGMFADKVKAARDAGLAQEQDDSPILLTLKIDAVLDRTRKISASDTAKPANLPEPATWEDYEQTRAKLKSALLMGDGLALGTVSHPHRAFGPIDLYTWIAFAGAHAARHAAQIREVGQTV